MICKILLVKINKEIDHFTKNTKENIEQNPNDKLINEQCNTC